LISCRPQRICHQASADHTPSGFLAKTYFLVLTNRL
jgi:hypothetical protein